MLGKQHVSCSACGFWPYQRYLVAAPGQNKLETEQTFMSTMFHSDSCLLKAKPRTVLEPYLNSKLNLVKLQNRFVYIYCNFYIDLQNVSHEQRSKTAAVISKCPQAWRA